MTADGPAGAPPHDLPHDDLPHDAIVLAGGRASRLGGASKPDVVVRGRRMLAHVLDAVPGASSVVVVGPPTLEVPVGVALTLEDPPDGGPVAGIEAGLAALGAGALDPAGPERWVLLLACDVPLVAGAVPRLLGAAAERRHDPACDGVMVVDGAGREQPLVGLYRAAALASALRRLAAEHHVRGASVRSLLGGLRLARLVDDGAASCDVDTWEDVRRIDG